MKKETVIQRLASIKHQLTEFGVSSLALFGSTVRGENTPRSDIDILEYFILHPGERIDILVDFADGQETYTNYLTVCEILQQTFKRYKVDIVTKNGLSPYIGPAILDEAQYV